jgi:hypothetical protein
LKSTFAFKYFFSKIAAIKVATVANAEVQMAIFTPLVVLTIMASTIESEKVRFYYSE